MFSESIEASDSPCFFCFLRWLVVILPGDSLLLPEAFTRGVADPVEIWEGNDLCASPFVLYKRRSLSGRVGKPCTGRFAIVAFRSQRPAPLLLAVMWIKWNASRQIEIEFLLPQK
jgi:hypothetical protein